MHTIRNDNVEVKKRYRVGKMLLKFGQISNDYLLALAKLRAFISGIKESKI